MAHPQQFLQHWFPPPQQQFATADFQELAKAAALRNNANHLALPVRLANSSSHNDHTNSSTVVRSLIRRFDLEGKHITVAENVRKWMEEDNPEWMVQIGRRVGAGYITKDGKAAFLFLYGDGYETLLLLDGIEPPEDLSKVPTIGISASFAPAVGEIDQDAAAKQGLLEPSDSLWEHVNFELNRQQGNDRSLVLHTSSRVSVRSYEDMHRKRVIRVWTLGPHRSILGRIERDTKLETQWKLGWRGSAKKAKLPAGPEPARALAIPTKKAPTKAAATPAKTAPTATKPAAAPAVPPPSVTNGGTAAAPAAAAGVATAPPADKPSTSQDVEMDAGHISLTFKPRELVLLERAFDDSLTDADLATNCELWGDDDFKAAFKICKTNGLRWTGIDVEKKRKSEGGASVPAKKPRVRKAPVPKVVKPPPPPPVEETANATADDGSKESGDTPLLQALSKEAGKPKQAEKAAKPTPSKETEKAKETKPTPSKEAEKVTKPTPSKEAKKPKETEKASKTKEAAKPKPATPKPKKSEPKVKAEVSSEPLNSIEVQPKESPTKDPETQTEKSSPDKNVSSALKKEKEDKDDDDKEEKPKKKGGRPKGSKNKSKEEKAEKKDTGKTRAKSQAKATDGKK